MALARVRLLLPEDALRLVGKFLERPTPSAAIVLEKAPRRDFEGDIVRWLLYHHLEAAGQPGWAKFLLAPAFRIDILSRWQVVRLTHRKLGYCEEFCGYCHQRCNRVLCERCFVTPP